MILSLQLFHNFYARQTPKAWSPEVCFVVYCLLIYLLYFLIAIAMFF